ncbi:MAG: DUF1186 domain-containing protein [Treponema sp.]|nr:DUF1186 domain-containing protein [Treponema sp.]
MTGFSDGQIISLLNSHNLWAKRACREILRYKDRFIPQLLEVLDKLIGVIDTDWDGTEEAHIPAAFLLAQAREPAAYPRLIRLISYAEPVVDRLWGDFLFEHYGTVLRDTYNGDASLLPRLIEDRSVSEWSRGLALFAWGTLFFDGRISRETAVNFLRRLIREVYTGKPSGADIIVLSHIADCAKEQRFTELLDDIKTLYDQDRIDDSFCGEYGDFAGEFNNPEHTARDEHIDDAVAELEKWRWFEERSDEDDLGDDYDDSLDDDYDDYDEYGSDDDDYREEDDGPVMPPPKRAGRNDPCPCGSGKKYKNCCLNKQL